MPKLDTNASKMPGHAARKIDGKLRKLRGDTKMETIEKRYGVKFPGRSDMKWNKFKEKHGISSVRGALDKLVE